MMKNLAIVVCLFAFCSYRSAFGNDSANWLEKEINSLVSLYENFHQNPELSFQEKETANLFAAELQKLDMEVVSNFGGFGVVGVMKNGAGPTLMLRTDLDGLPVAEETGLTFASKVTATDLDGTTVGVMHACGHDIHMTNLIGVARYLAINKDKWSGTVLFIGQPAEERGAGAEAMLSDGLFERFPKPDFGLAIHVSATVAAGKIGYRAGYALANVDSVDIKMKGRGGHGAYPHTTIDPIVQGAQLVMALQTIVSREIKPIEPAVITVGSIQGGTKHNVIGDSCDLKLTVRSYSSEVREQLLEGIKRKAKGVAIGAGAEEPIIEVSEGTPSLFNDLDLAERLVPVFKKALGDENVVASEPSMGGEDFSRYGRAGVPIMMFRVGAVSEQRLAEYGANGQIPPSLHSSKFHPDPKLTLETSIVAMTSAALELLKRK